MKTRRQFIRQSGAFSVGALLLPNLGFTTAKKQKFGVQLYSFRDAMAEDALGTLKKIADLGIVEIESARSAKGLYYGLTPGEMKSACEDLGMKLTSGHVALDDNFQDTMEQAAASGQEYVICSSMPSDGQTLDNYKKVAEQFNTAGEDCKKLGLKFGYHNHEYEFESDNGTVLYDVFTGQYGQKSGTHGDGLGMGRRSRQRPLGLFCEVSRAFPALAFEGYEYGGKGKYRVR